jgi:hypothetical protein
MSLRLTSAFDDTTAMFDSVTGVAFGPVMSPTHAADFLDHLKQIGERDPRVIPAADLERLYREWVEENE